MAIRRQDNQRPLSSKEKLDLFRDCTVSRSKNFFGVRNNGGFSRYSYLLRDCQNQPFRG